jgi:hypothetical protein
MKISHENADSLKQSNNIMVIRKRNKKGVIQSNISSIDI